MIDYGIRKVPAPEIYGDFWINSEPLLLTASRGNVILIDFWDYSLINCLRPIPYIIEWNKRYKDNGLLCIGIHSPQFQFGQKFENVQKAVNELGIDYPVVMDNQQLLWGRFKNRFLPTKYIIDKDGFLRYAYVGEGNYAGIERILQMLLTEAGYQEPFPIPVEPLREIDRPEALTYRTTPALFAGYVQGSLGNVEGYGPESTLTYKDPGVYLEGKFYLDGRWRSGRTSFRLFEEARHSGKIIVPYTALEVHFVIEPFEGPSIARIFQDDKPLKEDDAGPDIKIDSRGFSIVCADTPRGYCIIKNKEFGSHILKVETDSNGFTFHAISFISALIPEFIQHN